MADAADTFEPNPLRDSNSETGVAPDPDAEFLSADEKERLANLRQRVDHGDVHEWNDDYKRLRFARWLYEQGALQS